MQSLQLQRRQEENTTSACVVATFERGSSTSTHTGTHTGTYYMYVCSKLKIIKKKLVQVPVVQVPVQLYLYTYTTNTQLLFFTFMIYLQ